MDGATGRRLAWPAAASLTFLAAGCVLVLEIAAGRLLAPYVGVSLTTYTGIIGTILAGIALGAWLGGRAADRFGPELLIGPTFVLGGLAAILSVPIVGSLGGSNVGVGLAEIVVLATAGFILPATILSAVGPMIVRATITDLATSGSLVGRLSAIGTAGAIVGTFLTGFVLLGLVPTRPLVVCVGGLLVVVGVVAGLGLRAGGVGPAVLAVVMGLGLGGGALASPDPCQVESLYYCMSIRPDPDDPDGRFLVLDGLTHSYVDVADPSVLRFGYVRRFADVAEGVAEPRGGRVDVLHVGGGGFSFPRYLDDRFPGARQTILELDPAVLRVARDELGFRPSDRVTVVVGDARLSIADVPDRSVDLVVGDAFGGLAVPWHLTTREFLAEVARVLRPDGLYVMNLIDGPGLRFVRAEAVTAREVLGSVTVLADERTLAGERLGNVVLVASREPLDVATVLERARRWGELEVTGSVAGDAAVAALVEGAPVLRDDFAPVDQLLGR